MIFFDQRGIGVSQPALDCPNVVDLFMTTGDYEQDGETLTYVSRGELLGDGLVECMTELNSTVNLNAYDSAANATDVRDLVQALGYEQVNLWGISYGSRLGLTIMRDHPGIVRAAVIDALAPVGTDFIAEVPSSATRLFELLFKPVANDTACNAAYPDLREVMLGLVARWNETPSRLPRPTSAQAKHSTGCSSQAMTWSACSSRSCMKAPLSPSCRSLFMSGMQVTDQPGAWL